MDNPIAFTILCLSLVAVVYISWWSKKYTTNTKDFYVAGGKISARLNGWAMFGDYCSAASFLGVAGAIALTGTAMLVARPRCPACSISIRVG